MHWIRALWKPFGARNGDGVCRRSRPLPVQCKQAAWWRVMEFNGGPPRSLAKVERRFKVLAARAHPDRGGSADQMQALLAARAQARHALRT